MKVLLTGAAGQFGRTFLHHTRGRLDVVPTVHRASPDLPSAAVMPVEDAAAVNSIVSRERPAWVVHAASATDVDGCERDPAMAMRANGEGTENIAAACARAGVSLVYISTDYVFDGKRGNYSETDPTHPINAYGRSKLEGEVRAARLLKDVAIARTSVVFGPRRKNFVTWVKAELEAKKPIRVVRDQWVNPTSTLDLSRQVEALIQAKASGVYHTVGADSLSRLDMAKQIAQHFRLDASLIESIEQKTLNWVAARPANSTLKTDKIRKLVAPLSFPESLARFQEELRP